MLHITSNPIKVFQPQENKNVRQDPKNTKILRVLLLELIVHNIPTNFLTKYLMRHIRSILKNFYKSYVNIDIWGIRMRLRSKNNLSEKRLLLSPQFFDNIELTWMKGFLDPDDVFFDVGSNIGAYSFWAASLERSIKIEAFEPNPTLAKRCGQIAKNNNLNTLTVNQYAIGNQNKTGILQVNQTNKGESYIDLTTQSQEGSSVMIRKLSSVISEKGYNYIKLLKIDTEGDDLGILEKYFNESKTDLWPKGIICERIKEHEKTDSFFADYGYRLISSTRMNGIYLHQKSSSMII